MVSSPLPSGSSPDERLPPPDERLSPPDECVPPPDERVPHTAAVDLGTARLLPDVDRAGAWLLTVDEAPQSYVDLDDPSHLEFEYVRRLAHVLDCVAAPRQALTLLHLGGGGLTLPRYAAWSRPGSRQTVHEVDAGLVELVLHRLPPAPDSGLTVCVGDAAQALAATPRGSVDLVIADVFAGSRTPAGVTTAGFARRAAACLAPGGTYVANLADAAPFDFVRPQVAALAEELPDVAVIAEPAVLRGRRYGNIVLVGSRGEVPSAALSRRCAADPFPARVLHGERVRKFVGGARPVPDGHGRPSPPPPDGAFELGRE